MRLFEIQKPNHSVNIYAGRFSPFHRGHYSVYEFVADKADETYIATSNKTDPPNYPYDFQEKKKIMIEMGIPANYIVQTVSPYRPIEITEQIDRKYGLDNTILIFPLSTKNKGRFEKSFIKKDGTPGYFQDMTSVSDNADFKTADKHAYIGYSPEIDYRIMRKKPKGTYLEFLQDFIDAPYDMQMTMIRNMHNFESKIIYELVLEKAEQYAYNGNYTPK